MNFSGIVFKVKLNFGTYINKNFKFTTRAKIFEKSKLDCKMTIKYYARNY